MVYIGRRPSLRSLFAYSLHVQHLLQSFLVQAKLLVLAVKGLPWCFP